MNNNLLQLKIKERLNKLASLDYDNIECWQVQEAFNKAQLEYVRRALQGLNVKKEGSEQSTDAVDNVQILLTQVTMPGTAQPIYFQSNPIPGNYMRFVRVDIEASKDCCESGSTMVVYQAEEANVSELLRDEHKKPSFVWRETFCTLIGDTVRVYTNGEFTIDSALLTYYRKPRDIAFNGCINPNTGVFFTADIESELKDDVVEIIVDEAVSILAGDIDYAGQYQRTLQNSVRNS